MHHMAIVATRVCGAVALVLGGSLPRVAVAQVGPQVCGPISVAGQYGPWDYRVHKDKLPVVETNHFTMQVEALIKGITTHKLAPDLDYTLQKVPNHHRALVSVMRFGERKGAGGDAMSLPIECYFERALRWRSDDVIVRMLYSQFLTKAKRRPEAIKQLEIATELAKDSAMTHQNVGLVYLEMQEYDRALASAHLALSYNPNADKLADALKKAGKWVEPPPPAASAPESTASASAPASAPAKPE